MQKNENNDIRNMIKATLLAIVAIFLVDLLYPIEEPVKVSGAGQGVAATQQNKEIAAPLNTDPSVASYNANNIVGEQAITTAPANLAKALSIPEALNKDKRIKISTPLISGSIRLKGARFDDISLNDYRETLDPDSPNIVLFQPVGTDVPRYAEFGWISSDSGIAMPSSSSEWTASSDTLTVDNPVELTWDNGQGLIFSRTISIDDKYMFTITEKVRNLTDKPVSLNNYGVIRRLAAPPETDRLSYISYSGPIAVMNSTLEDLYYEDLMEKGKEAFTTTEGGWIGVTDKYWLSALVFEQSDKEVKANFIYNDVGGTPLFQTDYLLPTTTLSANGNIEVVNRIFVGAKEINTLDSYADIYNIPNFDLAIDFGWYYFLTKPFLYILDFLYSFLGNMGLAILLFALLLRLAVYPIANKSYISMQKMKLLQPKIKELTERYKEDRPRLSAEMMALYRKEKVNPASGCLPALIQIPIFFSLYKVLYIAIEMRQAPFYGWIHDLSAPDPTSVFTLFGLLNWPIPEILNIGVWPIIMGLTMYVQFKLNPTPTDKTQAMIFAWLPFIFTFMLAHFASGLVIYWAWSNILAIIQQKTIIYRMNKKLEAHTKLKDIN